MGCDSASLEERFTEIAELAEAVADAYHPAIRVEPEVIAKELGITFSYGHYTDAFDGMLEYQRGRFHIYCNLDRVQRPHSLRARFTLGHELGHYFIDEHRNALKRGHAAPDLFSRQYKCPNVVEREADYFSTNLLLPRTRSLKVARHEPVELHVKCL